MTPLRLSSRYLFRAMILGVVWAVVFTPLSYFATVQPRRKIALGDVSIIGITPDSRELVTCPLHHRPSSQFSNMMESRISGPLYLWNLQTGTRRVIPLPDELAHPLWENTSRTQLRIGTSDLVSSAIRGRWLQLGHNVENRGQGLNPAADANLVVNLDTGAIRPIPQRDGDSRGVALSPTGHWCVEMPSEEKQWDSEPDRVRLIETATGFEQLTFDSPSGWWHYAFSANDRWFAFAQHLSPSRNEEGLFRVWNIETRELLFSAKGAASIPVFSDDGSRVAVLLWKQDHSKLVVYDVKQRKPLREFEMGRRGEPGFMSSSIWMRFTNHDESLIVTEETPINWVEAGDGNPIRLSGMSIFNLRTGTQTDFTERFFDPRAKPCTEGNYDLPPFTLKMIPDQPDAVCDLLTGEERSQLPFSGDPIAVSKDGRTIILRPWEEFGPSPLQRLMEYLDGKGLPIPQWIWDVLEPGGSEHWQIVDVASGRVTASMPAQSAEHWMSSDGRTMLTKKNWESTDIHVWDFPPRKSYWSAALWALMAPAVIVLWWWIWRKPPTIAARDSV